MKLVVGLGNPGKKYEGTRHNVGFLGVERLAEYLQLHEGRVLDHWQESKQGKLLYTWCEVGGTSIEMVKPQTFMNDSGASIAYVAKKHQNLGLRDIYVIHDDLDIPLGTYKIQYGRGPRQHNGLQSIYERFGSKQFWHVRVGIENRIKFTEYRRQKISGEDYVLQRFSDDERAVLETVMKNVTGELIQSFHKNQV